MYILRDNENADTLPINKWTKIKGSFSSLDEIFYHFKRSIRKSEYDLMSISIVSPSTVNNINELDPLFMYSQLLKDSLLKIHYDKSAKSEFIEHLRAEYANKSLDLKSVNIFDQNYFDKSPIWWYTKELFIYEPLNRALRTQNTEIIVRMGFFIQDLHREIERLHEEQTREKCSFIVVKL
ncbi:unnamed protein product [Rotaria sp. Silwood2]|nr:unnamed protein product [Rotaria sp. Silwood2]CAF4228258.1 unnamed protein product [Rotaria sp. Silwood2]